MINKLPIISLITISAIVIIGILTSVSKKAKQSEGISNYIDSTTIKKNYSDSIIILSMDRYTLSPEQMNYLRENLNIYFCEESEYIINLLNRSDKKVKDNKASKTYSSLDLMSIINYLPKEIRGFHLIINCEDRIIGYYKENVGYLYKSSFEYGQELIDSCYELMVWYIKKKERRRIIIENSIILRYSYSNDEIISAKNNIIPIIESWLKENPHNWEECRYHIYNIRIDRIDHNKGLLFIKFDNLFEKGISKTIKIEDL